MENLRAGNLQMAYLQSASAARLGPWDLKVRRSRVFVESRCNNLAVLGQWEELAKDTELTEEEELERARLSMLVGEDAEFEAALARVPSDAVPGLRSARFLRRGSLTEAIKEAREAVAHSDDPAVKLELVRLLMMGRGVTASSGAEGEEVVRLVDELQGTPQANAAIAMGLGIFSEASDKARQWSLSALQDLSPSNPALLPAANYMVASGEGYVGDYANAFFPAYDKTVLEVQVQFALWLNRNGRWENSLALITNEEALQNLGACETRAQALAVTRRWDDLLALADAAANAPESFRLTLRALAAKKLGRTGIATNALTDALEACVQEGRVAEVFRAADEMGEAELADAMLISMCDRPEWAAGLLRVAQDRFGRRGQFAELGRALENVNRAAPHALVMQDYRRRFELLADRPVDPKDAAAAVAESPTDPVLRCTYALALLKSGRPGEALAALQEIDILPEGLAPADQAVVIAVLAANGKDAQAAALRAALDLNHLRKSERALAFGS